MPKGRIISSFLIGSTKAAQVDMVGADSFFSAERHGCVALVLQDVAHMAILAGAICKASIQAASRLGLP
jgi:hypothetical protein